MSREVFFVRAVEKFRKALSSQQRIAVLGWMDSNHSELTRRAMSTGRVLFIEKVPARLPSSVGYALVTPFMGHSDYKRVANSTEGLPNRFTIGMIKRVLKACSDILFAVENQPDEVTAPVVQLAEDVPPAETIAIQEPVPLIQTQQQEVVQMSNMEMFVKLFREKASMRADGLVSMHAVSVMRAECGITESATQLVKSGYLEQVTGEGKQKVGWYRAGPKFATQTPEVSDDPIERARALIATESVLLARQVELDLERASIVDQLARIATAKQMIQNLEDLFKK